MTRVITIPDLRRLIQEISLQDFMRMLIEQLQRDFSRWHEFSRSPRHATHFAHGVIELMPISDQTYYTFKYVNGHPGNPAHGKLNVVALGVLADVSSGYPLMVSEMTLLTALRTAATSALASRYLAPKGAKTFGIIGTGAQSEFQVLAHHVALGVDEVYYYDLDAHAMEKFARNLAPYSLALHRCSNSSEVAAKSAILTTATAAKTKTQVLSAAQVKPGIHINGIGGDCPGKTELDPQLTGRCKIVVELIEQTRIEGEIQNLPAGGVYAELWELASGKKPGRTSADEITLFDSVGFALEDYSALRLVHKLAETHSCGQQLELIPELQDPKDLFSQLT